LARGAPGPAALPRRARRRLLRAARRRHEPGRASHRQEAGRHALRRTRGHLALCVVIPPILHGNRHDRSAQCGPAWAMMVAARLAVASRVYWYIGVNPVPLAVVVPRVFWNRLPRASMSPFASGDSGLLTPT